MAEKVVDNLTRLGFTRYEAQAYVALLRRSPLSGYELAKTSGVPRPNVYAVLDRLEERGAVMRVDEGHATQFVPVAWNELIRRLRRGYEQSLSEARDSLGAISERTRWEPVKNTRGTEAVRALARDLLLGARRDLLLAVWPAEAEVLAEETRAAVQRGVRLTTLCLAGCSHGCGFCRGDVHRYRVEAGGTSRWLVVAADGEEVMTGEFKESEAMAVRTRQRLLVELAAWYIRHTIAVAALVRDLDARGGDGISAEMQAILRSIGSNQSEGEWLDQIRDMIHASSDRRPE